MPKFVPEVGDIVWVPVKVKKLDIGWEDNAKLEVKFVQGDNMYMPDIIVDDLVFDAERGFIWTPPAAMSEVVPEPAPVTEDV